VVIGTKEFVQQVADKHLEGNFLEKLRRMNDGVIKGNAKDQPSYRLILRVEAGAVLKQAADYFRLSEAELTKKRGQHRQSTTTSGSDGAVASLQRA
jgi:hypothetical protein